MLPSLSPELTGLTAGAPRIAGVDEAGRGPWAGPVVAAAVVLQSRRPFSIRVDDSKRLTALQRARAFEVILEHADVGVGIVCASEIDRRNIFRATMLAMQYAVEDLPSAPELVIVDGPHAPPTTVPCRPMIGGDRRCYVVSCASIIAKVVRDRLMVFYHRLAPGYAFHRHKGYGTVLHARRLRQFGPSVFHRHSFRPVLESIAGVAHDTTILANPVAAPSAPAQPSQPTPASVASVVTSEVTVTSPHP